MAKFSELRRGDVFRFPRDDRKFIKAGSGLAREYVQGTVRQSGPPTPVNAETEVVYVSEDN